MKQVVAATYILGRMSTDPKGIVDTALRTAKYLITDMRHVKRFQNRSELFKYSLQQTKTHGLILEFGVANGDSIRYISSKLPGETVYGFDCFTGLPEDWCISKKGSFSTKQLPKTRENVQLIVGLFQDTLNTFIKNHKETVRFIHMDADLYSSTLYVLKTLIEQKRIQVGTIIQFDELFNYAGWWRDGEYKALKEIEELYNLKYEFLGYSLIEGFGPAQVTVKILSLNSFYKKERKNENQPLPQLPPIPPQRSQVDLYPTS